METMDIEEKKIIAFNHFYEVMNRGIKDPFEPPVDPTAHYSEMEMVEAWEFWNCDIEIYDNNI